MKRFFGMVLAFVLVLNMCPDIRAYAAENVSYTESVESTDTETVASDIVTDALSEEQLRVVSGKIVGYEGTEPISIGFGDETASVVDGKYEIRLKTGYYPISLIGAKGYQLDEWWYEEIDHRVSVWQSDVVCNVMVSPIYVAVGGYITGLPLEVASNFKGYVHIEMDPEYAATYYKPSVSVDLTVFVEDEEAGILSYGGEAPILPYGDYNVSLMGNDGTVYGTYKMSFTEDSLEYNLVVDSEEEEEGFVVSFAEFEGGHYVAYDRQDLDVAVVTDNATKAIARNSDTGAIDTTGNGQVNFSVVLEDGYALDSISITEGEGNYKNLKTISTEGNVYTYRITKITGDLTVSVSVTKLNNEDNRAKLLAELDAAKNSCPTYYKTYCTAETANALTEVLETVNAYDLEIVSDAVIEDAINAINEAVAALKYKTAEVPQVYISTKDGVGNSLKKTTGYVSTGIVIAEVDGTLEDLNASIKVRGNSTANGPKKPYNIKLSSKQDVLGMGKAKKWCLLANLYDPSLMRNVTALNVAQEMGLAYTSENQIVEVWVDGEFKGCYLLTEAVEDGKTRVDIDVDGDDFILELERSRVEAETTYITNANGIRFSFKAPDEPTPAKVAQVQEVLDRITAVIDSGDYEAVSEAIDIESFAKFFVLNEYMRNNDFNFSSVYFYYKDGKLYAGPVWDFDLSSGNVAREENCSPTYAHASRCNFYPYLLKYNEFQKEVEKTFSEYKNLLESISAEGGFIDTAYETYKDVFARNFEQAGWDASYRYSDHQRMPLETYEENLQYFKNWLTQRITWMNKYYASLVPNIWVYPATVDQDCIEITWRELEGVESYRVYRQGADKHWAPVSGYITGTSFRDYTAEEGVEYRYDVIATVDGRRGTLDYVGVPAVIEKKTLIPFVVEKQPTDVKVFNERDVAEFTAYATGRDVKYMWFVRNPGSDKFTKTGVSTPTYSRVMYAKNDGISVYCTITDAYGNSVNTAVATARFVKEFKIVKDTEDVIATKSGEKVTFRIETQGEDVTYCWYYKVADAAGGDGKFHKAGVYTNEYTRTASEQRNGLQAYCVVTDGNGVKHVGRTATLILNTGNITVFYPNGKTIEAKAGEQVTFKVKTYSNDVTYSWFFMVPAEVGGDGIFHKAGCYSNEYVRTASKKRNGMQAYCVITDSQGRKVTSEVITFVLK